MFTTEHFIWIALCGVFVALMLMISRKMSLKTAGYIMTGICGVSEISKVMSGMMASPSGEGMILDPRSLPFHLCSLMIFAVVYITFGKEGKSKQTVINFAAASGSLGSFCAIMIPTNGTDFTTILAYQCFVYHAGLLWFALYLIISGKAKLGGKTVFVNIGILSLLAFCMIYINGALSNFNTNFMYVVRPPMKDLPFLNLSKGWYIYFLRLMSLGIVLVTSFHLPFVLRERRKKI